MKHGFARAAVVGALVAVVAGLAASLGTSTAPAGGTPVSNMFDLQDPVNNGNNAVYRTTFVHTGKSQTHVQFHNLTPENEDGEPATFKAASCTGTLTATEFVCDPIKLKKGDVATVTIVWQVFEDGTSAGCTTDPDPCMINEGFWAVDAGTNAPEKPKKLADVSHETELLLGNDKEKDATYAVDDCADPDVDPTLATNPTVDATNPLATIVCVPEFTLVGDEHKLGLLGDVLENAVGGSEPGTGQASRICIADESCTTPFTFDDPIVFVFLIHEETFFPGNEVEPPDSPVTQVFHDGAALDPCDTPGVPDPDPCVDSITSDGTVTTVVALGTDNGDWTFG